jgi:hypothetical protein
MLDRKGGMEKLKTFIKDRAYSLEAVIENIYDGVYITECHYFSTSAEGQSHSRLVPSSLFDPFFGTTTAFRLGSTKVK